METIPFEQAVLLFAQIHRRRRFERTADVRKDATKTSEITNVEDLRKFLLHYKKIQKDSSLDFEDDIEEHEARNTRQSD